VKQCCFDMRRPTLTKKPFLLDISFLQALVGLRMKHQEMKTQLFLRCARPLSPKLMPCRFQNVVHASTWFFGTKPVCLVAGRVNMAKKSHVAMQQEAAIHRT
jgi:hypothetical protein